MTPTSTALVLDQLYTRQDLIERFGITDATVNNGIFHPKGTLSVWLFVTEEKTADRTQYRDRLDGDLLHMQGQQKGRTDALLTNHQARGLELLVFFRRSRYEHPGAGFRYLGPFVYVAHEGSGPTNFVLRRANAEPTGRTVADTQFDPKDLEDGRRWIQRAIAERRGQRSFRNGLLAAYGGRCAISGCAVSDVLEAAHISPYRGDATNDLGNGLLLRADLHTLFDCGLITIHPETHRVVVSAALRSSDYGHWHGNQLSVPANGSPAPAKEALRAHFEAAVASRDVA